MRVCNFKGYKDAERRLYKTIKDVERGYLTTSQSIAISKIIDSCTKAHKLEENHNIIIKLDALEEAKKREREAKRNGNEE